MEIFFSPGHLKEIVASSVYVIFEIRIQLLFEISMHEFLEIKSVDVFLLYVRSRLRSI